jgi:hypothetical protein
MRCQSPFTLGCPFLGPTLWKPSGLVILLVVGFFGRSPTWARVCFSYNKRSFRYHANTSPFICKYRGKCLVINLSYHTYIPFIPNPLPYNTMYPSRLATSYSCPSFTMLMWSYYWRFKYPFNLVPLREWTYNSPCYTLDTIAFIALESGTHV